MATFTKAAAGIIGRSASIFVKAGVGIAGDVLGEIAAGSGFVELSGSARDASTFTETGIAARGQFAEGARSGVTTVAASIVAPAVLTSSSVITSATAISGQGNYPLMRCRMSYDLVSVATPAWVEIDNDVVRSFSVSRGRDTELSEFDAGTATVRFDNRDRAFDPVSNSSIRPMNRIWLYCEFAGAVRDLFKGYVTSWQQEWPEDGISDATSTASASDEFLVLNQAALPTTNPPRDSYADLVAVDAPVAYWDMNDEPTSRQYLPADLTTTVKHRGLVEFRRNDRRRASPGSRRKG